MFRLRSTLGLAICLLASPVPASFAHSISCVDQLAPGTPCCGQYECAEELQLTPASRGDARHGEQARHVNYRAVRMSGTALVEPVQDEPSLAAGGPRHD